MVESPLYLYGTRDAYSVVEESLGKYYLDILKKRRPEDVVNLDAVTGQVLTCGQLLEKSVKLAKVLEEWAVQKGDVVSIISPNSIHYSVPILSALYTGAISNLLNATYTIGELRHAFHICKPKIVICCDGETLESVLELQRELDHIEKVVVLEQTGSKNHPEISTVDNLIRNVVQDSVREYKPRDVDFKEQGAFILLSSGTTGLPKGVLITHQNFRTTVEYVKDPYCGNTSGDTCVPLFIPFCHVFGLVVLMGTIPVQYRVIVLSQFKPDVYLGVIEKYKVKQLFLVPPVLLFLVKSPLTENYDFSSVRDIIISAAPVGPELHAQANRKFPNAPVRLVYGITEVTGACIFQNSSVCKSGSVGELIPGLSVKIENLETKQALGPMEQGEICVRGPIVMKCYYENAESTRQSLDKEGFFHTGDVGYYDHDKELFIVDRIKELIKYKGFQVSPVELEGLLLSHSAIVDAAVIGIPDDRAGQLPLAFVVRREGSSIQEQDVVDFVAKRISPSKRLYGGVRFVAQIPKSSAGKILRKKLNDLLREVA